MKASTFKLKNDSYRRARGGYARFLNIYCSHCGGHILLYQKDGQGILKRMYIDRIIAPDGLATLQKLTCKVCNTLLATRYIYEKEDRPAFLIISGAISKKLGRGNYPPDDR